MIRRTQILHVARLAKIALSPEEERRLAAQVAEVLRYVERLGELDAELDAETTDDFTHVAPARPPPRPDEPRPSLPRDEVLSLAPRTDGETMHVPPVFEGGGEA